MYMDSAFSTGNRANTSKTRLARRDHRQRR